MFYINLIFIYLSIYFLDVSSLANLLLTNLKEIIEKLQSERNYFKNPAEKLRIEKKQLITSNKHFSNELNCLKEYWKRNFFQ